MTEYKNNKLQKSSIHFMPLVNITSMSEREENKKILPIVAKNESPANLSTSKMSPFLDKSGISMRKANLLKSKPYIRRSNFDLSDAGEICTTNTITRAISQYLMDDKEEYFFNEK